MQNGRAMVRPNQGSTSLLHLNTIVEKGLIFFPQRTAKGFPSTPYKGKLSDVIALAPTGVVNWKAKDVSYALHYWS